MDLEMTGSKWIVRKMEWTVSRGLEEERNGDRGGARGRRDPPPRHTQYHLREVKFVFFAKCHQNHSH